MKKKCVCLLIGISLIFPILKIYGQNDSEWRMKPLAIQTRWAKDIKPSNPLPEYPRPELVRQGWYSLNGLWKYVITSKDVPMPSLFEKEILVPYPIESALSGVKRQLQPNENLWYKKMFDKPALKAGERLLLHFGAVDYEATVFINGVRVGMHSGGYTEFSFDITAFIKDGGNELVVQVFDPTDKGVGPHGKQVLNPQNIYYSPSSGIWQTVWLEKVPTNYIHSLTITPLFDKQHVRFEVNIGNAPLKGYSIEIFIKDSTKIVSKCSVNESNILHLNLENFRPWSPDDPFLYNVHIVLRKDERIVDEVDSYFGMRKVSVGKDKSGNERIFLNNKYVYNLGALDQGFWPEGLYTAPTDEALAFDINACKAMGFNTIRKHVKIEPARWYYHADRQGILVWQDFVNPNQSLNKGAKIAFEKQIKETITQLGNHASIICWVIFNEKWGQYDQKRITEWVKKLDSSRLVNGHSGELLYVNNVLRSPSPDAYVSSDLVDVHSYPFPRNAPHIHGKIKVVGEFGGIGVPIEGHMWDDLDNGWGYDGVGSSETLTSQYSLMTDSIKKLQIQGLSASIYTQPFDVESEVNGILTYDRRIAKLPIEAIRRINSSVWPATLNSSSIDLGVGTADKISGQGDFPSYLRQFKDGRKDSAFLRRLTVLASEKNDSSLLTAVSNQYVTGVKDPISEFNLMFMVRFTRSSTDSGFSLLYKNLKKIDHCDLRNKIASLIMDIIYKEEIAPVEGMKEIDWDAISKKVISKYGDLGEERIWGNMAVYYATHEDWKNFGKYYKLYFDRAISKDRTFIHINNLSWLVFEHVTEKDILETAIIATKYQLDKNDIVDPNSIDTHANLLYKAGRKREAIEWEKMAVEKSNQQSVFVETLQKMTTDLPTWN